jgi:transposase
MGDLCDFERGQIVGSCSAGAPMIKTATLLGVSRATVSRVILAYTNRGKTSAKRNSGRESTLTKEIIVH